MLYSSYLIAGAILFIEDAPVHYKILTQRVIDSGISNLGRKGARTPERTLNRVLNQDHPNFFTNNHDGTFSFCEEIRSDERFARALKDYEVIARQAGEYDALLQTVTDDIESAEAENYIPFEGDPIHRFGNTYERSARNRADAIRIHGTVCMVPSCRFDFLAAYGERGQDFIEVHHTRPLGAVRKAHRVNPATDLAVVCANCHRIIHRRKDCVLTIEQVDALMRGNTE